MKKSEFYSQFKGTDTQVLKMGGSVAVPSKLNPKAEIIVSALAGASNGWDYTLEQIQESVFAHRGAKADWSCCGTFASKDLVTVNDIKNAILWVYFNCRDSEFWKESMLALVANKNGNLVIRKVEYIPEFFKAKEEKAKEEKAKPSLLDTLEALREADFTESELAVLADLLKVAEFKLNKTAAVA